VPLFCRHRLRKLNSADSSVPFYVAHFKTFTLVSSKK
jgi:hypothetical protein